MGVLMVMAEILMVCFVFMSLVSYGLQHRSCHTGIVEESAWVIPILIAVQMVRHFWYKTQGACGRRTIGVTRVAVDNNPSGRDVDTEKRTGECRG